MFFVVSSYRDYKIVHLSVTMVCKGGNVYMTLPRMRHQQSMPNLSQSSKLSLATTSRSGDQQKQRAGTPARRGTAQPPATNSYRLQTQTKQLTQSASKAVTSRQQVPPKDFKTRAAREQSPSSTVLPAKTNGTPRQPSRLVAPSR